MNTDLAQESQNNETRDERKRHADHLLPLLI